MALPNIFTPEVVDTVLTRIDSLSINSRPQWGKMNVAQMLAHCCVPYEKAYEENPSQPGFFKKLLLNLLVKKFVVNEVPYKRNSMTSPEFIVTDEKDFETEKARLTGYIEKTRDLGISHFEGKKSISFGELSASEWNNMFYKHLDHHLRQFGA
jgi:hypothetical protein